MLDKLIPKKIKGFRDINPSLNKLRWDVLGKAKEVYENYGYKHWDTPVLEYAECLGKYLPDKEAVDEGVYSFRNPEEEPVFKNDGSELRDEKDEVIMDHHFVSMRYDLTAPLARVYSEDVFPQSLRGQLSSKNAPLFRRYQFGPVYRFEAKLQPGRFREFWQLDFDTVGSPDVSVDAESCLVLSEALEKIGLERGTYRVKINNRKILKGLLIGLGITNVDQENNILRILDKLDKIGLTGIFDELGKGRKDESGAFIPGLGLDHDFIRELMSKFEILSGIEYREESLAKLEKIGINNEIFLAGMQELNKIDSLLAALGYKEDRVVFDFSLVRGMEYYTGPVYEVESLLKYTDAKGVERGIGTICAGGRYDSLVERLIGIQVPAAGASIGVDRLCELLVLAGRQKEFKDQTVFITVFDDELMPEYQKIAMELRTAGFKSEVYYGSQRSLKKQLGYADKNGYPVALLLGSDEHARGEVTVRDLRLGEQMSGDITDKEEWKKKAQFPVRREELLATVKKMLEKTQI